MQRRLLEPNSQLPSAAADLLSRCMSVWTLTCWALLAAYAAMWHLTLLPAMAPCRASQDPHSADASAGGRCCCQRSRPTS